ncbi:hypothetical protein [Parasegetibacter sp. NRK P23]|uniref:hypothetical protein n=1 Tax=Parasegetibacter sp. NRK P23 TaxID=2942999 RepID=UPI002042E35E|nr:hypothetical protein [Parasegetibacter sp. NRK P23]MCM5528943.1 hypothetical protein [Parasegetibacter sp. NRK P23]
MKQSIKQGNLQGSMKSKNTTVTVNLPVMAFIEDDYHIAYIPVLDLSGYGKSEQEAHNSLAVSLQNYIEYGLNKNTLHKDLIAHGWKIKKKTKPYIAPELTELIKKNEYLHDIVNTKNYSVKRMDVEIPDFA